MRESRTLRAMWRALETGPRHLLNGHEEGNLGYKPRRCLRAAAPVLDPTGVVWLCLDDADVVDVPKQCPDPQEQ